MSLGQGGFGTASTNKNVCHFSDQSLCTSSIYFTNFLSICKSAWHNYFQSRTMTPTIYKHLFSWSVLNSQCKSFSLPTAALKFISSPFFHSLLFLFPPYLTPRHSSYYLYDTQPYNTRAVSFKGGLHKMPWTGIGSEKTCQCKFSRLNDQEMTADLLNLRNQRPAVLYMTDNACRASCHAHILAGEIGPAYRSNRGSTLQSICCSYSPGRAALRMNRIDDLSRKAFAALLLFWPESFESPSPPRRSPASPSTFTLFPLPL